MDGQRSCVPRQPYADPSPPACAGRPWHPCGWPPAGSKRSGAAALRYLLLECSRSKARRDGLDVVASEAPLPRPGFSWLAPAACRRGCCCRLFGARGGCVQEGEWVGKLSFKVKNQGRAACHGCGRGLHTTDNQRASGLANPIAAGKQPTFAARLRRDQNKRVML